MVAHLVLLTLLLPVSPTGSSPRGEAPETYLVLATYYTEAGFPDSALQVLAEGFEATHAPDLLRKQVELRYSLRHYDTCVRLAQTYLKRFGPDSLVFDLAIRALLGLEQDRRARRLAERYLQAYPDLPAAARLAANLLEVQEKPDTALFYYRRAYLLDPENLPLLRDYLAFLVHHDHLEEAAHLLDRYGDTLQGDYKVELSWAVLLEKQGHLEEALLHYARANYLRPSPELLVRMAQISLQLERPQEAWRILEPALETYPLDPELLKMAGITRYHLQEPGAALHLLLASEALEPQDPETHYFLARTLRALGRETEALREAERAYTLSGDPDYGLYLAYLRILNNQPREALAVLRQLKLRHHAHFHTLRAFAFQLLGEMDSAYIALKRAHELDPRNPNRLRDFARFCYQNHRPQEALQAFLRLRRWGAATSRDLMALALLLADQGEYARADSVFRELYARDSTNALVLNNWGYTLAEWGQHLDLARRLLERALQLDPDNPIYLDSMGWIYYRLGYLQRAYRYVKRAVDLGARDPEILEHLGDILQALGRPQEARKYWQQALQLNPNNESLLQKLGLRVPAQAPR